MNTEKSKYFWCVPSIERIGDTFYPCQILTKDDWVFGVGFYLPAPYHGRDVKITRILSTSVKYLQDYKGPWYFTNVWNTRVLSQEEIIELVSKHFEWFL